MMVNFRHIALLAGVAILTACTGSEEGTEPTPPQQEAKALTFSGGLQSEEAVTRAGERGLEELLDDKTFQVWGYKNDASSAGSYTRYQAVMPDFTVNWLANSAYTTTSNTNDWEYVGQGATPEQQATQTIKYWDFAALAYRFFGYALGKDTHADPNNPSSAITTPHAAITVVGGSAADAATSPQPGNVTFTSAVNASTQATIDAAPYFSRLWFSTNGSGEPEYGKPVTLQFLKPFARVRFLFTFVEGLNFGREKLSHITFHPTNPSPSDPAPIINTAGTVSVTYPLMGTGTAETWTVAADPAPTGIPAFLIDYYEVPDPIPTGYPVDGQSISWPNTPEKWYYVLPNPTQGSFTLEVAVVSDDTKQIVVPAEYMQWKAGYEYTYKFKVTESGGITMDIIQVAINDWTNRKSGDHTVFNW